MKRLLYIAVALVCLTGCEQESEDITLTQMQRIESYLTSSHSPRLISYDNLGEYMDDNTPPQFYETFGRASYRYIVNYYETGRQSRAEVMRGSTISVTYSAYDFTSYRAPSFSDMYVTNDPAMEQQMRDAGWTLDGNPFFTFMPLRLTVGNGEIVGGVDEALAGCRVGDEVEIYCTGSVAYGENLVGTIPKDTPLYWHIVINGKE